MFIKDIKHMLPLDILQMVEDNKYQLSGDAELMMRLCTVAKKAYVKVYNDSIANKDELALVIYSLSNLKYLISHKRNHSNDFIDRTFVKYWEDIHLLARYIKFPLTKTEADYNSCMFNLDILRMKVDILKKKEAAKSDFLRPVKTKCKEIWSLWSGKTIKHSKKSKRK